MRAGGRAGLMPGWRILWNFLARIFPDQLSLIAAGVAFYGLMALFPIIAALIALAGLVIDPSAVVSQLEGAARLLPEQAAGLLLTQARKVAGASQGNLTLTLAGSVIFAVYLSTRATTGLIHGLNIACRMPERRNFVRYWTRVVGLTVAIFTGTLALLVLLVGLPAILKLIPLGAGTGLVLAGARWVSIAVLVLAGLGVLYRFGPSGRSAGWHWFSPGMVLAAALWFAGSAGFEIYVANFGRYNEIFGSLGGVVVLLTWLWLSAFVVLLGALLDHEIATARRPPRDSSDATG